MKRLAAILLSGIMALSMTACGDSGSKGADASGEAAKSTEATKEASGDVLNVCLASEPATLDPALNSAVDGGTTILHLFQGLARWNKADDGKMELVADAATELPEGQMNDDGTVTYTYTLRDGLKWSDGKELTANDFVFAWNRAASLKLAADYGYMMECIDGYDKVTEADADGNPVNPDAKLNVEAKDAKTLVVTLKNQISYWNELIAFPTYMPVREDVVANDKWATDPSTYIGNGAYTMKSWEHNSVITLEKNKEFIDADKVTMPVLNFYLSDDVNNMLTNYKNGDWQLIDNVPTNEIANLKTEYKDEFFVEGQLGTYYACWNLSQPVLPKDTTLTGAEAAAASAEIRNAIGLLFDRNYIVNDIAQGGQVPASSFVAFGLTEPDGSEFYQNAGSSKDFDGYYNVDPSALQANFDQAVTTLKKYYKYDEASKKFTNAPTFTYLYNTDDNHKAIGEYLQSAMASVGITLNLENQEWNTFLESRKSGSFTCARGGWLADYNDPISFLDMWITESGNNDCQFGKGDNKDLKAYSLDLSDITFEPKYVQKKVDNGTWAETYDALIKEIKATTDAKVRYQLMHKAEDLLMSTGCINPLYFYTDLYMLNPSVKGFYSNPLGFKYFMYTHY